MGEFAAVEGEFTVVEGEFTVRIETRE